ncbi:MAG: hypothetical protein AAF939_00920 [Planctomycetota bacterium]
MRFAENNQEQDNLRSMSFVNYQKAISRAAKRRLYILFGLLLLVIYLMNEAGKPESWEWMGFDRNNESAQSRLNSSDSSTPTSTDTDTPSTESYETVTIVPGQDLNRQPDDSALPNSISPSNQNSSFEISESKIAPDYPVAAAAFWNQLLRRFSDNRRQQVIQLIRAIRTGNQIESQKNRDNQNLIQAIAKRRNAFHQTLFDDLAVTPNGTEQKKELSAKLFESTEIWSKKVLPALESAANGEDFTMGQRQAVIQLQSVLDDWIFSEVKDKTSLGWDGDSFSWVRLWEKVLTNSSENGLTTSRIELLGQPQFYRGKRVKVAGWIRAIQKKKVKTSSQLDIPFYYELWIRPRESKLGPLNVFVAELPADFPVSPDENYMDVNIDVSLSGFFFKVRSFVNGEQQVDHCPVILAKTLGLTPVFESIAEKKWKPDRTFLVGAFTLIPMIAIGFAWFAFRSSITHKREPGVVASKRIESTLGQLEKDPSIQSDLEKVMTLYDKDLEVSHEEGQG